LLGDRFVDPTDIFCDGSACYFVRDGRSLFADSNHIAAGELEPFRSGFMKAMRSSGP
jgi:hypothetical protein